MSKASDKEKVQYFTRGVLDGIRDYMRKTGSKEIEQIDNTKEEIYGRIVKTGDRMWATRKIKE